MFVAFKLISRLLFPVALIMELLIAGLILLGLKKKKAGFALCIASLALFMLASMNPVADKFLWTIEGLYKPVENFTSGQKKKIEYIVVLGNSHSERPGLTDTVRLSSTANSRVSEAVRLSRLLPDAKVIFTGGVISGEIACSEASSKAALKYGLSSDRVLTEKSAMNTEQEARAVFSIAKEKTVLLVTSASHMKRAMQLFKAAGVDAVPAISDIASSGGPYSAWSYIPSADALSKTERAWYEYMGLAFNALRGIY